MKNKITTLKQFNNLLKKIVKEEISKEPFLKDYCDSFVLESRRVRIQNELYEGLITSQSIERCFISFNNKFKNQIKLNKTSSGDLTVGLNPFSIKKQYYSDIVQLMNNLGWYLTDIQYFGMEGFVRVDSINSKELNDKLLVNLTFSAKFDIEVNNDKLPKYIYHVTKLDNKDKILKNGLVPKSKNKSVKTQDSIYFSLTDNNYKLLAKKLYPKETKFILLKINTEGLKNTRFIYDTKVSNQQSIFTLENIGKHNIEEITEFEVK